MFDATLGAQASCLPPQVGRMALIGRGQCGAL